MKLDGIHHITAITADAHRNVDFYARVMGLRLVKKSVNQDDRPSTTSSSATSAPTPGWTSPSSSIPAPHRAGPATA
jgi:glyoxalase family protein